MTDHVVFAEDEAALVDDTVEHARRRVVDLGDEMVSGDVARQSHRRARPRFGETYVLGRIEVVYREVPHCHTCQKVSWEWRQAIELAYLDGESYKGIHRALPEDVQAQVSHESIRRHCIEHLPKYLHEERASLDVRLEEAAQRAHDEHVIDFMEISKVSERRVYRKLRRGEIEPTISDVIGLNRLRLQMGLGQQADEDREIFKAVLASQLRIASRYIPPEMREAYVNELRQDPALQRFLVGEVTRPALDEPVESSY